MKLHSALEAIPSDRVVKGTDQHRVVCSCLGSPGALGRPVHPTMVVKGNSAMGVSNIASSMRLCEQGSSLTPTRRVVPSLSLASNKQKYD